MGKNVEKRRLEAFVLGAAVMGLAGALYVHFMRAITPEAIDPMIATFLVWIMLILGGSGNNRGAILGAIIVWLIWSMSEFITDQLPAEVATQAQVHPSLPHRPDAAAHPAFPPRRIVAGRKRVAHRFPSSFPALNSNDYPLETSPEGDRP